MTAELCRVFGRIGLLSFGGPAAQIALMHKELVEKRDWLTEDQFLRALSFCMLLPGPEAMQLATYVGWRRGGIVGGLIGGGLFVLPGALVIFGLALAYGAYGDLPALQAIFVGIKATVVIIVIEALIKVSKRALKTSAHLWIAAAAFVALFLFDMPFPAVIATAALAGAVIQKGVQTTGTSHPNFRRSLGVLGLGCCVWLVPLGLIVLIGPPVLADIAVFFSKLAVVTFGGAYAVLAYMTQEVVGSYGWLTTTQMIDALGLAETTPGPLILMTQFVGMLAGADQGGTGLAIAAGLVTLWVTFVPCFVWIFAGAPLIDWLQDKPKLQGALSAITAAVVGVIANLSLWFAIHVVFQQTNAISFGPIQTLWPVWSTVQPLSIALMGLAGAMLLWRHWPLPLVLLISAALGLLLVGV